MAALWNEAVAADQRHLLESLLGQVAEKAGLLSGAAHGDADLRDRVETLAEALHDLAQAVGQARDELVLAATAAGVAYSDLARWCHEPVGLLQAEVEDYRAAMIRLLEPDDGPGVDR